MPPRSFGAALLATGASAAMPAAAHVIVGVRLFPVTLTCDDPGVADEGTLPAIVAPPGSGGQQLGQLQWEYDKTITPTTALIYNQGYDTLWQPGSKLRTGPAACPRPSRSPPAPSTWPMPISPGLSC